MPASQQHTVPNIIQISSLEKEEEDDRDSLYAEAMYVRTGKKIINWSQISAAVTVSEPYVCK